MDFVTLRAPPGTDEAAFGDTLYRVDPDFGTIKVPREIAHHFIGRAGFEPVPGNPETPSAGSPIHLHAARLVAPPHLAPTTLQLADGTTLTVPADGIVEVGDSIQAARSPTIEGVEPAPAVRHTGHVGELVRMGFRHLPASGPNSHRPARGRFAGDFYFDETTNRPTWFAAGAWRTADGKPV